MKDHADYFRTLPIHSTPVRVDRENGIIHGFAVLTQGETNDKRGTFDADELDNVVDLGNQDKRGIKSRFGHPNMSSTALGTFLGRVKNFRRDGEVVRADLYLEQAAYDTPNGDLATYVMDLAESDPDAFGASMVIRPKKEETQKHTDTDKKELNSPLIRVEKLRSVDVVDEPAANSGFFSKSVQPSFQMSQFLDQFLSQPQAVQQVLSFLQRYQTHNPMIQEKKEMTEPLTQEQFKQENPEFYESIYQNGVTVGQEGERERTVNILTQANDFQDMNDLALSAIKDGLSSDKALITFQGKQLNVLQSTGKIVVGPDKEDNWQKANYNHFERAQAYQAEYGGSMTVALQKTAQRRP